MPMPMPYARSGVLGGMVIQVSRCFCISGEISEPVAYDTTHVRRSAIVEMSSPAVNAQLGLRLVASASVLSSVCTVVPCANGIGNASPAGHHVCVSLSGLNIL